MKVTSKLGTEIARLLQRFLKLHRQLRHPVFATDLLSLSNPSLPVGSFQYPLLLQERARYKCTRTAPKKSDMQQTPMILPQLGDPVI